MYQRNDQVQLNFDASTVPQLSKVDSPLSSQPAMSNGSVTPAAPPFPRRDVDGDPGGRRGRASRAQRPTLLQAHDAGRCRTAATALTAFTVRCDVLFVAVEVALSFIMYVWESAVILEIFWWSSP